MNHRHALAAAFALLATHSAHAQDVSTEVGSATVWFALLVVLFALLVSVGLYMARDHDDDPSTSADAQPQPAPARSQLRHAPRQRPARARRKQQQEFS